MTCAQMGGPCEEKVHAETAEDMMQNGWKHVEQAHPEMKEGLENMPQEAKDEWTKKFKADWEQTPDMLENGDDS